MNANEIIRRSNNILESAAFNMVEIVEDGYGTVTFNDRFLNDHLFVRANHIVYQNSRGNVMTVNESMLSADAMRQVRHSRSRLAA